MFIDQRSDVSYVTRVGIVQHEFFVAATPVIAFKTGGLKDSVKEFNPIKREGNGFTFEVSQERYNHLCNRIAVQFPQIWVRS